MNNLILKVDSLSTNPSSFTVGLTTGLSLLITFAIGYLIGCYIYSIIKNKNTLLLIPFLMLFNNAYSQDTTKKAVTTPLAIEDDTPERSAKYFAEAREEMMYKKNYAGNTVNIERGVLDGDKGLSDTTIDNINNIRKSDEEDNIIGIIRNLSVLFGLCIIIVGGLMSNKPKATVIILLMLCGGNSYSQEIILDTTNKSRTYPLPKEKNTMEEADKYFANAEAMHNKRDFSMNTTHLEGGITEDDKGISETNIDNIENLRASNTGQSNERRINYIVLVVLIIAIGVISTFKPTKATIIILLMLCGGNSYSQDLGKTKYQILEMYGDVPVMHDKFSRESVMYNDKLASSLYLYAFNSKDRCWLMSIIPYTREASAKWYTTFSNYDGYKLIGKNKWSNQENKKEYCPITITATLTKGTYSFMITCECIFNN